ncbi:hypothetical protein EON80_21295, partial [bacterium]
MPELTTGPLTGSRKVYLTSPTNPEMRVPARSISQSPTRETSGNDTRLT